MRVERGVSFTGTRVEGDWEARVVRDHTTKDNVNSISSSYDKIKSGDWELRSKEVEVVEEKEEEEESSNSIWSGGGASTLSVCLSPPPQKNKKRWEKRERGSKEEPGRLCMGE